jgi:RNA polymerase sigma-70 factor (ECF subfamily)
VVVVDRDRGVENLAGLMDSRAPSDASGRFAAVWAAHYPQVLAYARRRASEPVAAEVATASFLVLWRRIDDPPVEPLPWLYAVARKELANWRRSDRRHSRLVDRLGQGLRGGASTMVTDAGETAVEALTARAALSRLRAADREVLMLVAWEGLDPARAAASLGVSPDAFAVRLHRARRRLESQLSNTSKEAQP